MKSCREERQWLVEIRTWSFLNVSLKRYRSTSLLSRMPLKLFVITVTCKLWARTGYSDWNCSFIPSAGRYLAYINRTVLEFSLQCYYRMF
jgi:hypothetical protein